MKNLVLFLLAQKYSILVYNNVLSLYSQYQVVSEIQGLLFCTFSQHFLK